ncbi:glycosyltransferase [Kutzneria viridogrisea]|uniref:Uncharacterized protein n=2 Tax=Kutzneria TaxID=43356 RepID=W5W8G2_9PSEU|nr:glycosyltransferase [Kutzneria albida]AHH97187.1 hypothetical protein KALB_3823 [Kutzneria albida DSM 43870]MBA8930899.1 UDP:flavonoid glycosyltransferase YjiC (YdhE family) [Kutzneria viridogrisea]MBA8931804.1 UDP:flavonoid glycosyltransferase YjiC (YdhE family) [Kutzneria viridogrisea]
MRLLFSSGAGHSHIVPMLPLAVAARDAGHEVVFVTGPTAVEFPQAAGLHTVAIGSAVTAPPAGSIPPDFGEMSAEQRLSHIVAHYMVGIGAAARLDDMLAFVREWRPGLVVANLAERAAVMAAALAEVPYAMHAIGPPKTAAVMAEAWQVAERLVGERGLDGQPSRDAVPYLDIWPDGLCPAGVEWEYPTRWPLRPDTVLPQPGDRPAVLHGLPHRRTVYLTLGTTHNTRPGVLEAMVEALHGEPVNVIVTIGHNGDRARFGAQPGNVRIEHFVPQSRLLPHVDLVVCHAGAGSVLGALAHGVPLVVSPLATDQFDMADQVVAAGAGLHASPDQVGVAARQVLADTSFRAAATGIGAQLRAMPSPAEVLERLLTRF